MRNVHGTSQMSGMGHVVVPDMRREKCIHDKQSGFVETSDDDADDSTLI